MSSYRSETFTFSGGHNSQDISWWPRITNPLINKIFIICLIATKEAKGSPAKKGGEMRTSARAHPLSGRGINQGRGRRGFSAHGNLFTTWPALNAPPGDNEMRVHPAVGWCRGDFINKTPPPICIRRDWGTVKSSVMGRGQLSIWSARRHPEYMISVSPSDHLSAINACFGYRIVDSGRLKRTPLQIQVDVPADYGWLRTHFMGFWKCVSIDKKRMIGNFEEKKLFDLISSSVTFWKTVSHVRK